MLGRFLAPDPPCVAHERVKEDRTMRFDWNWTLLIGGALLVLVEVALGGFAGFDLVLIGSALIVGGAVGLATGNAGIGFGVASVLALAYIVFGRRWVRERMRAKHQPSNADALIGLEAMVVESVETHRPGQVRVRDEIWRAVPASGGPFSPGTIVRVEGVDGVTLRVRG
jgi:membrane protein implicated in regulation of membrane protease activity